MTLIGGPARSSLRHPYSPDAPPTERSVAITPAAAFSIGRGTSYAILLVSAFCLLVEPESTIAAFLLLLAASVTPAYAAGAGLRLAPARLPDLAHPLRWGVGMLGGSAVHAALAAAFLPFMGSEVALLAAITSVLAFWGLGLVWGTLTLASEGLQAVLPLSGTLVVAGVAAIVYGVGALLPGRWVPLEVCACAALALAPIALAGGFALADAVYRDRTMPRAR